MFNSCASGISIIACVVLHIKCLSLDLILKLYLHRDSAELLKSLMMTIQDVKDRQEVPRDIEPNCDDLLGKNITLILNQMTVL